MLKARSFFGGRTLGARRQFQSTISAMAMAAFRPGWTNRTRCRATKRDGTPCGRLAMTRYGLSVCGAHGGYAAASVAEAAVTLITRYGTPGTRPGAIEPRYTRRYAALRATRR